MNPLQGILERTFQKGWMSDMMRIYLIICVFLLSLTGYFDLDLRPPDSVVTEVIGCKTEGTDLFCLTRYPG